MESFRANIFDCLKQPDEGNSRFVNKHVRKLTEVENFKRLHSASPRIPAEGSSLRMFGCEWFDLGDKAMLEMSISARDILAKIMDEKWRRTASHFRYSLHVAEVILLLRMILGRTDSDGKELQAAISKLYNVLPEPVRAVMNTSRTSVDEMSVEMYDSFHGMLNFQWYGFLIVYEMEQRGKLGKPPEDYESIFRRLIEKLIRIAVFRYAHLSKSDLPSCGPFYCTCVRNFWFAVIIMAKSGTKQLDFWDCLHNALEKVQKGADAETELPANDSLFIVWFIHGIASLRQYSHLDEQTFLETPVVETGNNFTLLDKAVKEFTEKDKPEEQLRVLLLLIRPIYCDWWRPLKHDFLFPLWEYFSKRLNSSFELPPNWLSKPAPPTINRSLTELLKQASYQASKKSYETMHYRTSSLSCFLRLLTFMVRHYSDKEQKQKVQILFNRTVLRLTPAKLALLTEQGIYNYALIMIAMVESTPYQNDHHRVSKQMLQFKLIQPGPTGNIDITIRRIITICMGNAALLVVLSRRQFDKTAYLKHLLDMIETAWRKYGDRLQPALHVLAEAMDAVYNDVISTKRQLDKGDEKFIGGWLSRYLGGCSKSERVALYKTVSCLFSCLRLKQSYRTEDHHDLLRPLYEIVLSSAKNAYIKADKPCSIIAKVAADFTLFSTGQPFADHFYEMVSNFADNRSAHPGMRLKYVTLIVTSERASEIEQKFIIKYWLKLAFQNTAEEMREFSQLVLQMSEFRALCEIPSHDLIEEGEEPLRLFFKFVGKKYRELEGNSSMQYDMQKKIHSLFKDFDRWFLKTNASLLNKILSILALALKECAPLIYIRSNGTCLYHLAFTQYFLPMSVLTNRGVPNELVLAMRNMWYRIMDAIGRMRYDYDNVIGDHVTNMMVKWAPHFDKFKDKKDIAKPYTLLISSLNGPFVEFAFKRYLFSYVELQKDAPKTDAEIGLRLLLYVLESLQAIEDNGKIALFIRLAGSTIMTHASFCADAYPSKLVAISITFSLLDYAKGRSNQVKDELQNSLGLYIRRHLPSDTSHFYRFIAKLADRNPVFMKPAVTKIRAEIWDTECLKDDDDCKNIRRQVYQLDGAVEAIFKRHQV